MESTELDWDANDKQKSAIGEPQRGCKLMQGFIKILLPVLHRCGSEGSCTLKFLLSDAASITPHDTSTCNPLLNVAFSRFFISVYITCQITGAVLSPPELYHKIYL